MLLQYRKHAPTGMCARYSHWLLLSSASWRARPFSRVVPVCVIHVSTSRHGLATKKWIIEALCRKILMGLHLTLLVLTISKSTSTSWQVLYLAR